MSEEEKDSIRRNLRTQSSRAESHHACLVKKLRAQREAFKAVLPILDKAIESGDFTEAVPPLDYVNQEDLALTLKELGRAAQAVRDYRHQVE